MKLEVDRINDRTKNEIKKSFVELAKSYRIFLLKLKKSEINNEKFKNYFFNIVYQYDLIMSLGRNDITTYEAIEIILKDFKKCKNIKSTYLINDYLLSRMDSFRLLRKNKRNAKIWYKPLIQKISNYIASCHLTIDEINPDTIADIEKRFKHEYLINWKNTWISIYDVRRHCEEANINFQDVNFDILMGILPSEEAPISDNSNMILINKNIFKSYILTFY